MRCDGPHVKSDMGILLSGKKCRVGGTRSCTDALASPDTTQPCTQPFAVTPQRWLSRYDNDTRAAVELSWEDTTSTRITRAVTGEYTRTVPSDMPSATCGVGAVESLVCCSAAALAKALRFFEDADVDEEDGDRSDSDCAPRRIHAIARHV